MKMFARDYKEMYLIKAEKDHLYYIIDGTDLKELHI